MQTWKNNRPTCMQRNHPHSLTHEDMIQAADALSNDGLQLAAVGFFLMSQELGYSPAAINDLLTSHEQEPAYVEKAHIL